MIADRSESCGSKKTGRSPPLIPAMAGLAASVALLMSTGCASAPQAGAPHEPAHGAARSAAPPASQGGPTATSPESHVRRQTLSEAARGVRFAFESHAAEDAGREAVRQLRADLVRAGYVLLDGRADADAVLRVDFAPSTVDPAGQPITARLSLELIREGAVVRWLVAPIATADRMQAESADLVERLTTSPSLATVARLTADSTAAWRLARLASRRPIVESTSSEETPASAALARRCRNRPGGAACMRLGERTDAPPVLDVRSASASSTPGWRTAGAGH